MLYQAVIFDMDGTLIDAAEGIGDSMNHVLEQNDLAVHPLNDYIKWIGDGMENLVIRALPADKRDEDFVKKCVGELKVTYAELWSKKTHLYPGIADLLNVLRQHNFKLAILSNKPHQFTRVITDKLLSEWNFDAVYGLREGYQKKPDPTTALEIAGQLNIEPSNIIYLGDSSTDIKTAINAGMYPVGVSWGYRSTESLLEGGAQKVIHKPEELLSVI
jgi:phosphoglycolate phosphatase